MTNKVLMFIGLFLPGTVAQAASFDCAKANAKVEKIVCGDSELSKLDKLLAEVFVLNLEVDEDKAVLRDAQKEWLKERNRCEDRACIKAAYEKRVAELSDSPAMRKAADLGQEPEEFYRYKLEQSSSDELCNHMTHLFNEMFKTPWYRNWVTSSATPETFGVPADKVFERLPGVEYNKHFTYEMLLSKFPSSPEYDAVQWQEGRFDLSTDATPSRYTPEPMLVTKVDIDNDGDLDWVVKDLFMERLTTNEGWDQNFGGADAIEIFSFDGLDLTKRLTDKELYFGQRADHPPRQIDRDISTFLDTMQLRPFIFKGQTYLSAYQQYWTNQEASDKAGYAVQVVPVPLYPEREYMNIFRVKAGGKRGFNRIVANTESVCRIRMIMQNQKH